VVAGTTQVPVAGPLLAVLATGVFLEALNGASYHALLAAGDARTLLRLNIVINAVFAVALPLAVLQAGAIGAAVCWLPLQVGTFLAYAWKARMLGRPVTAAALRAIAPGLLLIVAASAAARFSFIASQAFRVRPIKLSYWNGRVPSWPNTSPSERPDRSRCATSLGRSTAAHGTVRLPAFDFGSTSPACASHERRTWITPASRSTSSHRSARSSPYRSPA
jgi:hypothetical protein